MYFIVPTNWSPLQLFHENTQSTWQSTSFLWQIPSRSQFTGETSKKLVVSCTKQRLRCIVQWFCFASNIVGIQLIPSRSALATLLDEHTTHVPLTEHLRCIQVQQRGRPLALPECVEVGPLFEGRCHPSNFQQLKSIIRMEETGRNADENRFTL